MSDIVRELTSIMSFTMLLHMPIPKIIFARNNQIERVTEPDHELLLYDDSPAWEGRPPSVPVIIKLKTYHN